MMKMPLGLLSTGEMASVLASPQVLFAVTRGWGVWCH